VLINFFISDVVRLVPPATYLAIRALFAFFLFIPTCMIVYYCAGEKEKKNISNFFNPVNRSDTLLKLAVMGIFESSIPLIGYSFSDLYLPPDVGTVLLSISPLCSFFFRWIFPKIDPELPRFVPTKKVVLGICVGFIGAAIVVARPYLSALATHTQPKSLEIQEPWVIGSFLLAVLSLAFSTTYWSTYGTYLSPKKEKIGVFVAGIWRNFFGFWVMFIFMVTIDYFMPFTGKSHFGFYEELTQIRSWISIIWMTFGPAYINIIAFYFLVQKMGAEKTLTTNFLVPVLGNIIGLVYDNEWRIYNAYDYIFQFGGALVVIIGLVLCTMDGLKRRKERRNKPKHHINETATNSDAGSFRGPTTSDTESGWDIASFKKYPRV